MTDSMPATQSASCVSPHAHLARQKTLILLLAVWLTSVLAGMYLLWRYESTPGPAETALEDWPAASAIVPATDRPTLLLFLHPHCPCSRASLTELTTILSEFGNRVDTRVIFCQPTGVSDDWWQTEMYALALEIPGVRVSLDLDNVEGRCFGAKTSGHALLFSHDGHLLFTGGITVGRGHVGQNAGRAAIESILRGDHAGVAQSLVFGCPLVSSGSDP